jgi:hypothetical protein
VNVLGRIELLMGNVAAGTEHYRFVLETSRDLDLRIGIAAALDYLGEVAIWAGDATRAVRLGAVAERLREELGGGIPPRMGGALEPLVAGRAALSPEDFRREEQLGHALDIDSAIAEALATTPPTTVPTPIRP